MSVATPFTRLLSRFPAAAAVLYLGLVVLFAIAAWTTTMDILGRREAVAATADVLNQLNNRKSALPRVAGLETIARPTGSPLVEGATVTVAGANLLRRVAGAVTQQGGNILSTQVDLQGPRAKEGFVGVTVSCEMEQPVLQQLLYDLEVGMPFLFVDQLVVQGPAVSEAAREPKLRIVISVSGQWQGSK